MRWPLYISNFHKSFYQNLGRIGNEDLRGCNVRRARGFKNFHTIYEKGSFSFSIDTLPYIGGQILFMGFLERSSGIFPYIISRIFFSIFIRFLFKGVKHYHFFDKLQIQPRQTSTFFCYFIFLSISKL